MTTLIIARHCESTWHIEGRLAGQQDEAVLTGKGRTDAIELAKKLNNFNIDSIYSSKLKRAVQTAEIIGKYLNKSVNLSPALNEGSWGVLEGKFDSEIQKEMENGFTFVPPKGESFPVFVKRITNTLLEILEQQDHNTILIVTHSGVKEAFEMLFKTLKPNNLDDLPIIVTGLDANVIKSLQKSYN